MSHLPIELIQFYDAVEADSMSYVPFALILKWAQDRFEDIMQKSDKSEEDMQELQELEKFFAHPNQRFYNMLAFASRERDSKKTLFYAEEWMRSLSEEKVDYRNLYNMSLAYFSLGDFKNAAEYMERALQKMDTLQEPMYDVHFYLWWSYFQLKNYQKAVTYLLLALEWIPEEYKWILLADLWLSHLDLKNHQKSIDYYKLALANTYTPTQEKWQLLANIATNQFLLDHLEESIRSYQEALDNTYTPSEVRGQIYKQLADIYQILSQKEEYHAEDIK